MLSHLEELRFLERDEDSFGMVHFDYSDGNYHIDFSTGKITVFDFGNACFCWYLYDLANLWRHGVGWFQSEPDAARRRRLMAEYFDTMAAGYRSEISLPDAALENLPLLVQTVLLENLLGEFESLQAAGEEPDPDEEELAYLIRCFEEDIPYFGFFHEIYRPEAPFTYG